MDRMAQVPEMISVLIAIEPRTYREAIGGVVQSLRPHLEVLIIEPGDLDDEVTRLHPELVICGQPESAASAVKCAWVEYRPYAEPAARISMDGRYRELSELDLEDFLTIVDEAEKLCSSNNHGSQNP